MLGGLLMIKIGNVTAVDEKKCKVRVKFDESDLISAWIPVIVKGSLKNKDYWIPSVNEHVVVVYTEQKVGAVIGAIYSEADTTPIMDKNKRHMLFEDGTFLEYDFKEKKVTIDCKGEIKITTANKITIDCASAININAAENVNVTGDVIADGISLKNHTHPETQGTTLKPI